MDDRSWYVKKLRSLLTFALLILIGFTIVLSLNFLINGMDNAGGITVNNSSSDIMAENESDILVQDPGSTVTPDSEVSVDTSVDDDRTLVSMSRALSTIMEDSRSVEWQRSNSAWLLSVATTDSVNRDGLAYKWNIVLRSNDSVLIAGVENGQVSSIVERNLSGIEVSVNNDTVVRDSTEIMKRIFELSYVKNSNMDDYYTFTYHFNGIESFYEVTSEGSSTASAADLVITDMGITRAVIGGVTYVD